MTGESVSVTSVVKVVNLTMSLSGKKQLSSESQVLLRMCATQEGCSGLLARLRTRRTISRRSINKFICSVR